MQFTIYFNQKPLVLTNTVTGETEELRKKDGVIYIDHLSDTAVADAITKMQQSVPGGIFYHNDVIELLEAFKKKLYVIKAAGGLAYTKENKILLIFRKGKWDLPKGKLDEGESLEACAVREVEEETGLQNIVLENPLTITYHTYTQNNTLILKESHWYFMRCNEQALKPQLEEDIDQCIWVNKKDVMQYLQNTHPSIKDVLKAAMLV